MYVSACRNNICGLIGTQLVVNSEGYFGIIWYDIRAIIKPRETCGVRRVTLREKQAESPVYYTYKKHDLSM